MTDLLVADPEYIEWAYELLKTTTDDDWKDGHEQLINRIQKMEQERVDFYVRRITHLEAKLSETEINSERNAIYAIVLGAALTIQTTIDIFKGNKMK